MIAGCLTTSDSMAASCSGSADVSTFPGGYLVKRTCGGYQTAGFGTSLDDAHANLQSFANLIDQGARCNFYSIDADPGTYRANFTCRLQNADGTWGGNRSVGGMGYTASGAAGNLLAFAQLFRASEGYACRSPQVVIFPGGFVSSFSCGYPNTSGDLGRSSTISGVGSNTTDAASVTVGFAELGASIDRECWANQNSVQVVGSNFKVTMNCNGTNPGTFVGLGSTATAAGNNALLQAQFP